MTKKVIDPQPIINELAQRCLKAKGLECSLLGEVIDMLKAAKPVHNAPYWATEEAFKRGYEKGYEAGKPKWIPVGERFPKLESYVYTVDVLFFDYEEGIHVGYANLETGAWKDKYSRDVYADHKVTHWMPLPEAPKEG